MTATEIQLAGEAACQVLAGLGVSVGLLLSLRVLGEGCVKGIEGSVAAAAAVMLA